MTSFPDRTFTFVAKMPSSSHFILKAAGLEKGASAPGNEVVGALSVKHIYEIAKVIKAIVSRTCMFVCVCARAHKTSNDCRAI